MLKRGSGAVGSSGSSCSRRRCCTTVSPALGRARPRRAHRGPAVPQLLPVTSACRRSSWTCWDERHRRDAHRFSARNASSAASAAASRRCAASTCCLQERHGLLARLQLRSQHGLAVGLQRGAGQVERQLRCSVVARHAHEVVAVGEGGDGLADVLAQQSRPARSTCEPGLLGDQVEEVGRSAAAR